MDNELASTPAPSLTRDFAVGTLEINFTFYRSLAGAVRFLGLENATTTTFTGHDQIISKIIENNAPPKRWGFFPKYNFSHDSDIDASTVITYRDENKSPTRTSTVEIYTAYDKIECRDWRRSELSSFLSDDFMSSLIAGHFHIRFKGQSRIAIDDDEFIVPLDFQDETARNDEESIAALEGTVFRNGYVSIVLRLRNSTPINQARVLELIKRPDQLVKLEPKQGNTVSDLSHLLKESCEASIGDKCSSKKDCGILNVAAAFILNHLDNTIIMALQEMGMQFLFFDRPKWTNKLPHFDQTKPWNRWSRPYIGTIFSLHHDQLDQNEIPTLNRFIIAAGRTTPEFFPDGFENPDLYLSDSRNVYGDGGSIVFVASRGWCVWNADNTNASMFRFAVVEMTHFVVMALECSLRARRRFHFDVRSRGAEIIRTLDIAITRVGRPFGGRSVRQEIRRTSEFVGKAYVIAPFDDGASILAAHLKTHTARAANIRYRSLKALEETDAEARKVIDHYVAALETATSYILYYTARLSRIQMWIVLVTLIIFVAPLALQALEYTGLVQASTVHQWLQILRHD